MLVAGGPGQGKTTTLAALVEDLTARRPCRVVTIEEPVEYLLKDRRGVVVQREVGTDVPSTAAALRSVSRQDVDVLVVGDLADPDGRAAGRRGGRDGRLVLAGLLAGDVPQVVDRLTAHAGGRRTSDARADRGQPAGDHRPAAGPAAGGKRRGPAGTLLRVGPRDPGAARRRRRGARTAELPGSLAFEPPAEPPRKRRPDETRAAVEDDAPGD